MNDSSQRWIIWICLGVFILLVIVGVLIFCLPEQWSTRTGSFVEAVAIILLVTITWYYALQTRELAKEQKRARREIKEKMITDFMKQKAEEFYDPFLDTFDNMIEDIKQGSVDINSYIQQYNNLVALFNERGYVIANEGTRDSLRRILARLENAVDIADGEQEIREEFLTAANKLREKLSHELKQIKDEIRDSYGPSNREK